MDRNIYVHVSSKSILLKVYDISSKVLKQKQKKIRASKFLAANSKTLFLDDLGGTPFCLLENKDQQYNESPRSRKQVRECVPFQNILQPKKFLRVWDLHQKKYEAFEKLVDQYV